MKDDDAKGLLTSYRDCIVGRPGRIFGGPRWSGCAGFGRLRCRLNGDGSVEVEVSPRQRGAGNIIVAECVVNLSNGGKLTFRDAEIGSAGCSGSCSLIVINGGAGSRLKVIRSTIDISGQGQLAAGSSGEENEPNGSIRVLDSTVRGSDVYIGASIADVGGRVKVRRSLIESTGGTLVSDVFIGTGTDGTTVVTDNTIDSAADIVVTSGFAPGSAVTKAKRNDFTAAGGVTITSSAGGSCTSTANTPATPCTP